MKKKINYFGCICPYSFYVNYDNYFKFIKKNYFVGCIYV